MAYHGHTVSTNKLCISKLYHQMFTPTISVAAWIFSSSQPLRVPLRVSVASLLDLTWGIGEKNGWTHGDFIQTMFDDTRGYK